LDEPTVGLDPQQIIEIRQLIRQLAKDHTVILSSHILAEVSEVCDHILIISKGKLVASDTAEHLEAMKEGESRLELLVKGDKETVSEILSQVEGLQEVLYEQGEEEGTLKVIIQTGECIDVRENVFFAFAEKHCAILEMQRMKSTLEDIFLELTQQNEEEVPEHEGDL
jgi:ABC-2 type transport system ATP-binding protein